MSDELRTDTELRAEVERLENQADELEDEALELKTQASVLRKEMRTREKLSLLEGAGDRMFRSLSKWVDDGLSRPLETWERQELEAAFREYRWARGLP